MEGDIELNYALGNYAVDFDGRLSSHLPCVLFVANRTFSTPREHHHVVEYRSLRIGHMCESTLLCSAPEKGRQSRTFCHERALRAFVR